MQAIGAEPSAQPLRPRQVVASNETPSAAQSGNSPTFSHPHNAGLAHQSVDSVQLLSASEEKVAPRRALLIGSCEIRAVVCVGRIGRDAKTISAWPAADSCVDRSAGQQRRLGRRPSTVPVCSAATTARRLSSHLLICAARSSATVAHSRHEV